MKVVVYTVGKLKWAPIQQLAATYIERLTHYTSFAFRVARDEAEVMAQLSPGDFLMVCDERGGEMSSVEFSQLLAGHQLRGSKRLILFIGGPEGMSEHMRRQAQVVFALSQMTLPHELALVVLVEQLYRAFTILKGEPYHK